MDEILARLVTVDPDGKRTVDYLTVIIAVNKKPPVVFIETPAELDRVFEGQVRGIEIDADALFVALRAKSGKEVNGND